MIKAGSLLYALIISLLIAIVSSSLILFAYLSRIEFNNLEINQQVNRNADSGLNLLLGKQSIIALGDSKELDLYNLGKDSVILSKQWWGAYEIILAKASYNNQTATRMALVGYYPAKPYSIQLADRDKPLALCGKAIIKGAAYLPKAGVKRAYIEGQSFIGTKLIDGEIKTSDNSLPTFNKELIDNINVIFSSHSISSNDKRIELSNSEIDDSLKNSFSDHPIVIESTAAIHLKKGSYQGNIAIISDKEVIISANTHLNDVLVFAPKVIIESGFRGNVQIFASDSIIVKNGVQLIYPSVLGLIRNNSSVNIATIIINENSSISGNVFASNDGSNSNKKTSGIVIKKNARVTGQVYSNGFVDIKGTIHGSLMCNKLMLRTSSSVYENHILNATIDATQLSQYYVGINLVKESSVKKTVKWLN